MRSLLLFSCSKGISLKSPPTPRGAALLEGQTLRTGPRAQAELDLGANRLGLDPDVLARAHTLLDEGQRALADTLERLHAARAELSETRTRLATELREVEARDGRRDPVPAKGERQLAREAAEAARAEAIAEAAREAAARTREAPSRARRDRSRNFFMTVRKVGGWGQYTSAGWIGKRRLRSVPAGGMERLQSRPRAATSSSSHPR